jgi:hypothetical protein
VLVPQNGIIPLTFLKEVAPHFKLHIVEPVMLGYGGDDRNRFDYSGSLDDGRWRRGRYGDGGR